MPPEDNDVPKSVGEAMSNVEPTGDTAAVGSLIPDSEPKPVPGPPVAPPETPLQSQQALGSMAKLSQVVTVQELKQALQPLAYLYIGQGRQDDDILINREGTIITYGDVRRARALMARR